MKGLVFTEFMLLVAAISTRSRVESEPDLSGGQAWFMPTRQTGMD